LEKIGNDIRAVTDGTSIQVNGSNQLEVVSGVRFSSHKVTALIGDGVNNVIAVTHGLNTRNIEVTIREVATQAFVIANIEANTLNQATFTFIAVPTVNAYEVTIIG
jgi:hypothetical protein